MPGLTPRRVARLPHRTRRCAPLSDVRFRANRTLSRHRRMTESDPGCVKTLRGMTAPGILRLVVTFRAKKCRNLSSAQHYDQSDFVFTRPGSKREAAFFGLECAPDGGQFSGGVFDRLPGVAILVLRTASCGHAEDA